MDWDFQVVAGPYGNATDGPAWDGAAMLFTELAIPSNTINNRVRRYDPQTGDAPPYRGWTNRVASLPSPPRVFSTDARAAPAVWCASMPTGPLHPWAIWRTANTSTSPRIWWWISEGASGLATR